MMGVPREERAPFVATFEDCRTIEFAELMIGLAREVRATRPLEAAERARLGLAALDSIEDATPEMVRSKILALAELGNAFRLSGNLALAQQVLDEASRHLAVVRDIDLSLLLYGIQAQVFYPQGRFEAIEGLRRRGLRHSDGASKAALALFHLQIADSMQQLPAEAFCHCEAALRLLDPMKEQRLIGGALQGLGHDLLKLGYIEDAVKFLRRSAAVLARWGSQMDEVRGVWMMAVADQRRGAWNPAEDKLRIVTSRLPLIGQPITTALALLDLTRTYARAGHWSDAERAALSAQSYFAKHGTKRYLEITEAVLAQFSAPGPAAARQIHETVQALL